jgi:virulence-associated protein VagC
MDMQQIIMDTSALRLPEEVAGKIGTKQVVIREVEEGFLLTPVQNRNNRLRGMLKGKGFTTERYFQQKQRDKELEI